MFNKSLGKSLVLVLIFSLSFLTIVPSFASAASNESLQDGINQLEGSPLFNVEKSIY